MNVGYLITQRADLKPDKPAAVFRDTRLTYRELNDRVNRLAGGLNRLGVRKADRVAILLHNCHQYFEAFFACAKLGAVLVPVNWRLAAPEVQFALDDSQSETLLFGPEFTGTVAGLRSGLATLNRYIYVDAGKETASGSPTPEWAHAYDSLLASSEPVEPAAQVDLDDELIIMYTSGTTGRPKGAVMTHNNILWTSLNQIVDWEIDERDTTLVVCPIFHVSGLLVMSLPTFHVGGTVLIQPGFEAKAVLEAMARERVTTLFMVPSMWHLLLQEPEIRQTDFSSLRLGDSGGAPLPHSTMASLLEILDVSFVEGYGVTEAASCTSVLRTDVVMRKRGSIGKPFLHNEWRVVKEDGTAVAPGEVGEIILRGPTVMKGYWNLPEATAAVLKGGWFYTGDLARVDEEGFVYIVDRKKDMIISGGENIYPAEIEHVLYAHPAVLEAAVVGVPDPVWGEVVKAFIVTKPGLSVTGEEIVNWCRQHLASYKKPRHVQFVSSLPRNPSGKVEKPLLRKQFGGGQP